MDIATILADIKLAVKIAHMAYELKQDSGPFIKIAYQISFEHKILTAEERQELINKELSLRSDIDAVIDQDDKADD